MTKIFLEAAVEIAQQAGKVLCEEMERPADIAYKGDFDLVTQADRRSEALIVSSLQKYFPKHSVAAEEGTGKDTGSEYRWHVDPLDGTTNFAHRYPCFCVSMALTCRDQLQVGVIYNPVYGELFCAARGEGATFNGKKDELFEDQCHEEQSAVHWISQPRSNAVTRIFITTGILR